MYFAEYFGRRHFQSLGVCEGHPEKCILRKFRPLGNINFCDSAPCSSVMFYTKSYGFCGRTGSWKTGAWGRRIRSSRRSAAKRNHSSSAATGQPHADQVARKRYRALRKIIRILHRAKRVRRPASQRCFRYLCESASR